MVNVRQAIDCVRADIWEGDPRVNFHTAIKVGRILANHIDAIDEKVFAVEQLEQRHAQLVEAAKAVYDDAYRRDDGSYTVDCREIEALRQALADETHQPTNET